MRPVLIFRLLLASLVLTAGVRSVAGQTPPAPAAQYPSPMVESSRRHERLLPTELGGSTVTWVGPGEKPVELWVPDRLPRRPVDLVIHFHGAGWLAARAVAALGHGTVSATLNLGTGSGVYDRTFQEPAVFDSLLVDLARRTSEVAGHPVTFRRVTLSGWSAGNGAIRAILRDRTHAARVDGVLVIDGMHTGYLPDRVVVAAGGQLDSTNLLSLAAFAEAAVAGRKRMLITHSEIFPGTFASTTETADWMLQHLNLSRRPVLRWGPRGLQQTSEARAGRFELIGYAGNSAPDHVDQLHAIPELLRRLLK